MLISFLLVNVPFVDACEDRSLDCNEQNLKCCKNLCADDENAAEESAPNKIPLCCFDCCSPNPVMVLSSYSFGDALLLLGTLTLAQHFAFPAFVTSIDRPPKSV